MDKPMPAIGFYGMSIVFKLRDLFRSPNIDLQEVGLKPGFQVLDYGCGPGGYIPRTSALVGEQGRVYALDIIPAAVQGVQKMARRKGLGNVETICSDCQTGLDDNSLDVVLLYDIFHMFSTPESILAELRRVLKPGGILSVSDHHMQEQDILSGITGSGLFRLSKKGEHTYSFVKQQLTA